MKATVQEKSKKMFLDIPNAAGKAADQAVSPAATGTV